MLTDKETLDAINKENRKLIEKQTKMKTKEFNLSEKIFHMKRTLNLKTKEKEDFDFVKKEDVKEFIRLLKEEIDKLHDKQRDSQETTSNPEVALERLNKANLIYGNGGILEEIDKLAGEKLK